MQTTTLFKIAGEGRKEDIEAAIKLYKEAIEKSKEAKALFERAGIEMINKLHDDSYTGKPTIQLYSGLWKISELYKQVPVPQLNCWGEERENIKTVEIDGTILFQIGKANKNSLSYE